MLLIVGDGRPCAGPQILWSSNHSRANVCAFRRSALQRAALAINCAFCPTETGSVDEDKRSACSVSAALYSARRAFQRRSYTAVASVSNIRIQQRKKCLAPRMHRCTVTAKIRKVPTSRILTVSAHKLDTSSRKLDEKWVADFGSSALERAPDLATIYVLLEVASCLSVCRCGQGRRHLRQPRTRGAGGCYDLGALSRLNQLTNFSNAAKIVCNFLPPNSSTRSLGEVPIGELR
jgi:hypothetical protein